MLKLSNISKSYGDNKVLKNLNLNFNDGQVVFLVGRSGCGKTTLLNLICGLDSVDSGEMYLDSQQISFDDRYRANDVAIIFQEHNLLNGLNVKNNIALGKSTLDKVWIENNITKFGLNSNQKANTLSTGQKQRVAFLRAMYKNSKIILADEPTAHLDKENSDLFFQNIRDFTTSEKVTIIVTHDIEAANKYADRIIKLEDGNIISDIINDRSLSNPYDLLANTTPLDTLVSDITPQNHTLVYSTNNTKDTIKNSYYKKFHSTTVLTSNYINRNFIKLIVFALLISIGISFVSLSFKFNDAGIKISRDFIQSMDGDLSTVVMNNNPEYDYRYVSFGDEQSDFLNNNKNINKVVPQYANADMWGIGFTSENQNYSSLSFSLNPDVEFQPNPDIHDQIHKYATTLKRAYVREIDFDDFFKNRLSSDIDGDFPSDTNQIIIGQDLAFSIFGTDESQYILRKQIYLFPGNAYRIYYEDDESNPISYAESVPVQIVGINKKLDTQTNANLTYVSWHSTKQLMEQNIINTKPRFAHDDGNADDPFLSKTGWPGYNVSAELAGISDLILNDYEVAVSSSLYKALKTWFHAGAVEDFDVMFESVNDMISPIGIYVDDAIRVRIVKVFDDIEDFVPFDLADSFAKTYLDQIVISENLNNIINQIRPVKVQVYTNNPQDFESFYNNINKDNNYNFVVYSHYQELLKYFQLKNIDYSRLILVVAIALLFFVLITILVILKLNISKRKYELAVLKSLGFSKFKLMWLFFIENILIFVSAFVASFVMYFASLAIFKNIVGDSAFNVDLPVIYMMIVSLVLIVVSTIFVIAITFKTASSRVSKLLRTYNI